MSASSEKQQTSGGLSEALPAAGLIGVGAYLLMASRKISVPAGEETIGPRFFPYTVGGLLIVVGLWLFVAVLLGDRGEPEGGEDVDDAANTDWRTVAAIAALLAGYAIVIQPVGYLLSTIGLFAGLAWILGARNPRALILISLLAPFVTYMLFTRGLGVYLPNGILEAVI